MTQSTFGEDFLLKKKSDDIIEIWIDGSCAPINPEGTGSIG